MDANAFGLCKANQLPIVVFNMNQPGTIARVLRGEPGRDHRPMTTIAELTKHARELMHKAVESTKREFTRIRSGKASTSLLDLVRVEAYGSAGAAQSGRRWSRRPSPGCSPCSPSTSRWPTPSRRPSATPTSASIRPRQGDLIRVPLPALTEERRKELVKVVHKLAEEGRIAVRHARDRDDSEDQEAREGAGGRQDAGPRRMCRSSPTSTSSRSTS